MTSSRFGHDAWRILRARALRGFADGFVSVILAAHLEQLGFTGMQTGAILTATLLGSAALTLAVGLWVSALSRRLVLLGACALMAGTGLCFAGLSAFAPLLLVAFVGTLNPSAGDVSVFLPTEQALLAELSAPADRPTLFARYNLGGTLLGAAGSLASGVPALLAEQLGIPLDSALRAGFAAYGLLAGLLALEYRRLSVPVPTAAAEPRAGAPLARSRSVVLQLSALFSLDALGGGFVVQALLALWLLRRFGLSLEATGAVLFGAGILSALGQLLSAPLARRIGLVRTMVYTHIPANALLALAPFMPGVGLAVACLLARMALAQMDVPARQALVMAIVPPEERAAAASVTNVPRSLAAALAPFPAGILLGLSSFGWPLVVGGGLKIVYDLLLLARFHQLDAELGG